MLKTLYIHIGTAKTGTSALQTFFRNNEKVLFAKGIYYPKSPGNVWSTNHFHLYFCFYPNHAFSPEDIGTPDEEWGRTIEEIRATGKDGLISCEALENLNLSQINSIKRYCEGFNIKIIAQLRRQDSYAESLINQIIKTGAGDDIRNIINKENYYKFLDYYEEVFGKQNIIVLPYEKSQFLNGNIYEDFLNKALGLKLTKEFSLVKNDVNTSLSNDLIEYMRLINQLPISREDKQLLLSGLQMNTIHRNENGKKISLLSPFEKHRILRRHEHVNERVARDYLKRKDGKLFYDELPDINEPWEPYQLSIEKAVELSMNLLKWKYGSSRNNHYFIQALVRGIAEAVLDKSIESKLAEVEKFKNASIVYTLQQHVIRGANDISSIHMMPDGLHLTACGKDPHFILPKFKLTNKSNNLIIKVSITTNAETIFQLFHKQDGVKFSEEFSKRYPLIPGKNEFYIELLTDSPCTGIRIDPGTREGKYIIHELEVRSIDDQII